MTATAASDSDAPMDLTTLPDDVILHILSCLDPSSLLVCELVSKSWKEMLTHCGIYKITSRRYAQAHDVESHDDHDIFWSKHYHSLYSNDARWEFAHCNKIMSIPLQPAFFDARVLPYPLPTYSDHKQLCIVSDSNSALNLVSAKHQEVLASYPVSRAHGLISCFNITPETLIIGTSLGYAYLWTFGKSEPAVTRRMDLAGLWNVATNGEFMAAVGLTCITVMSISSSKKWLEIDLPKKNWQQLLHPKIDLHFESGNSLFISYCVRELQSEEPRRALYYTCIRRYDLTDFAETKAVLRRKDAAPVQGWDLAYGDAAPTSAAHSAWTIENDQVYLHCQSFRLPKNNEHHNLREHVPRETTAMPRMVRYASRWIYVLQWDPILGNFRNVVSDQPIDCSPSLSTHFHDVDQRIDLNASAGPAAAVIPLHRRTNAIGTRNHLPPEAHDTFIIPSQGRIITTEAGFGSPAFGHVAMYQCGWIPKQRTRHYDKRLDITYADAKTNEAFRNSERAQSLRKARWSSSPHAGFNGIGTYHALSAGKKIPTPPPSPPSESKEMDALHDGQDPSTHKASITILPTFSGPMGMTHHFKWLQTHPDGMLIEDTFPEVVALLDPLYLDRTRILKTSLNFIAKLFVQVETSKWEQERMMAVSKDLIILAGGTNVDPQATCSFILL